MSTALANFRKQSKTAKTNTTKKPAARKKKATGKSSGVLSRELSQDPAEQVAVHDQYRESGQRIKAVARGFRLKFNDIGKSRKLTGEQASRLTQNVDCNPNQLRLTKILYSRHPSLTAVQTSRRKLTMYWQAKTLKYPEDSVRLLPVRTETEAEQQAEVRAFLGEINEKIADFRAAIDALAEAWPDVMETCRENLRELHNPADYPTASQLHQEIGVQFEAYNFELPEYLKAVDPAEYRRQQERLNQKFTEVAERQAELLEEAMASGLHKMVASVRGWQDGKQRGFRESVVANVFRAIEDYKSKIEPFGIMNGRQIAKQFDELHQLLTGVGSDASDVTSVLRKDASQREFVLGRVSELTEAILGMSSEQTRRKVLRPAKAATDSADEAA